MQLGRRQFLSYGMRGLTVLTIGGLSDQSPAAARFRWPGGKQGAVSLTYDDGLPSQLDYAMPQLEADGFRGTFFVTGDAIPARDADWRLAASRGHEIADHTIDHPCDLRLFKPHQFLRREIAPMVM
jgi:peptidoglycan/xylan/chitin deacetylase (PgdA/CDA1 family)